MAGAVTEVHPRVRFRVGLGFRGWTSMIAPRWPPCYQYSVPPMLANWAGHLDSLRTWRLRTSDWKKSITLRVLFCVQSTTSVPARGNSPDKLRHPRSDAYSAQQVLLNTQQIWCGGAYLDCYPVYNECASQALQSVDIVFLQQCARLNYSLLKRNWARRKRQILMRRLRCCLIERRRQRTGRKRSWSRRKLCSLRTQVSFALFPI